jgi:hypothetical protein
MNFILSFGHATSNIKLQNCGDIFDTYNSFSIKSVNKKLLFTPSHLTDDYIHVYLKWEDKIKKNIKNIKSHTQQKKQKH